MNATVTHHHQHYAINLAEPISIAIPLRGGEANVTAWYLPPPVIAAVEAEGFTGNVARGGAVNFNSISFNPHAHATHTECVGHISRTLYSINDSLSRFFFMAELITVAPGALGDDFVISKKQLEYALRGKTPEAIVIRTLPNDTSKLSRQYSHTNPPYFTEAAAVYLREAGIMHLLTDLPSIDKEKDEGKLPAHKAFWDVHGAIRTAATITELIYVPNAVKDGSYLLNLHIAPFENDAAPSRPVLYKIL